MDLEKDGNEKLKVKRAFNPVIKSVWDTVR